MRGIVFYKPEGVCSQEIHFEVKDGRLEDLKFVKGCAGNALGVAALAKGRKLEEIIGVVEGITCGKRPTSCPDQLAKALRQYLETK
jgi:uncharacterized protein (TIGR03905 family)